MRLITLAGLVGLAMWAGNLPAGADDSTAAQKERNGGYYLFHQLCEQEADVDMIMLFKNAPPEIGQYTKELAALAHESLDTLDAFQSKDKSINFDVSPLPPIEEEVRAAIKADKQHQLLFGTTGPAFSRALVVAQIEATMYAKRLASVLATHVTSEHQRTALDKLSGKWDRLLNKGYALLGSSATR